MLRSVFAKSLRDRRRSFVWWVVGMFGYLLLLSSAWPTLQQQRQELSRLLENYPESLLAVFGIGRGDDLFTPAGFLDAQIYGWLVPLVFLIVGIGFGSAAIAGEEERKTMDLLLANPLTRSSVVVHKLLAMAVLLAGLGLVLFGATWAGAALVGMDIGLDRLAAGATSGTLLGWVFGALALAIGCATGRRGLALGVAAGLGVVAFLANSLWEIMGELEPARRASPFYYYASGEPLVNGLNWWHAGVLAGLAILFGVLGVFAFRGRDVSV